MRSVRKQARVEMKAGMRNIAVPLPHDLETVILDFAEEPKVKIQIRVTNVHEITPLKF